ncbi:serine/threonine-protein kinase [Thermostichus vulcanus]|uniref:non-specific serine/threonine protein kinase n=1 Tax=Thermostichus vulcanus str. 'Rupite' TaxID=2813851 RepID=A0ABT0CAG3_THEVL|nr:protein kinase [Thermostichus vulcanus]MCJ2542777.1 protein kinase [Thermostichus vulcanus str. 'Rupite']
MPNCYCLNPACLQPENPPEASTCAACGHPLLIRNRYRAFKRIGQGGFGSTFLVRDQDMPSKPWRVIKQLRPVENSPQIAKLSEELFNREAQVLERLGEHSQIPKLFAHFQEGGNFYLVQEFVQGITLSQEMHRNGAFSEEQARQVMQEVLLILSYVHSHNTVHRDIKPANLIRRKEDQRLVLIDFGAVKELGPSHEQAAEVTAIRSLGFSPPEQVQGQAVGPSSDLYALAATCINLMTLESPAKFYDHDTGQWDWSGRLQLSPEFNAILTRMLQQAVNQRFATATEVLRALQGMSLEEISSSVSQPIVLPNQPIGISPSPSMISSHWARRRSEGFSQPIPSARPTAGGIPSGGLGASTPGFTQGRVNSTTGFGRVKPATPPRIQSMAGADLRGQSFANQNLAGQDFRRADIRGADFSGANLQRADLRGILFNTPQPSWLQALSWLFGPAKTVGGIMAGLGGLLGSGILAFLIIRLTTGNLVYALGAALIAFVVAGSVLWSMTGRVSLAQHTAEENKRFTNLRKADLRGAQMDEKFRKFARRQGALL